MHRRNLRLGLAATDAFLALTAAWGALLVVPQLPPSILRWGPFTDFTMPAFGLGVVAALALAGVYGVVRRPCLGAAASVAAGSAIIVFELVEAAVVGSLISVPPGMPAAGYVGLWLQPFYLVVGAALLVLGWRLWRAGSAQKFPERAQEESRNRQRVEA